jgi:RNA polymerase sigma-70 factor (ECF subfamily)
LSKEIDILVARLKNKDKAAFEEIYTAYFGMLVNYAFRYLDRYEDCKEVVQDVFIKFWDKCEHLADDTSVKSYLYRSVQNTCLNQIKRSKVQDQYIQYVIQRLENDLEENTIADQETSRMERILAEIENLPPRCAEIFKLSRFEGLKYQEIADHLDLSIKTVEVQMGKALKQLRQSLIDLKNS